MTKCPDCGGTHVRCAHCGARFDTVERRQLVIEVLRDADAPLHGTELADLTGYSVPGVYKLLRQLVATGTVEKAGSGKERRGFRLATRVLVFPQPSRLQEQAA